MSNQDSFINEVSEEVRRDRLYALYRKYGWIAVALVVLIVGGATVNEVLKARAATEAEAAGDAVLAALETPEAGDRAAALATVDTGGNAARAAVVALAQAAAEADAGNTDRAVAALDAIASDPGAPRIYQEVAALKAAMVGADSIPADERIQRLAGLADGGGPFRLLALEQIALAEIQKGSTDQALETLREILIDANVTEDLRRRASQLIVALGGSLSELQ